MNRYGMCLLVSLVAVGPLVACGGGGGGTTTATASKTSTASGKASAKPTASATATSTATAADTATAAASGSAAPGESASPAMSGTAAASATGTAVASSGSPVERLKTVYEAVAKIVEDGKGDCKKIGEELEKYLTDKGTEVDAIFKEGGNVDTLKENVEKAGFADYDAMEDALNKCAKTDAKVKEATKRLKLSLTLD